MSLYSLVADYRDNMKHFNKREYESSFTEYKAIVEAELENITDTDAEAASALEKLDSEWSSARTKRMAIIKQENDKVFISCYLNPALGAIGTEKSIALENSLKACWDKKYPKEPYVLGSYERIADGFATRIFGLKISRD